MSGSPLVLTLPAALGGVLYFLGYLGWDVWPCLFVFLVPLWWALERTVARGWRAALLVGMVFGLVAYAGGFVWLWCLVDAFLDGNRLAGAVMWGGYGLWFAGGFGVYALLFRAVRRRGWPVVAAGVPSLVVVEWLQPQLFPVNAGSALVNVPLAVQTADLGGPLLLTALLGVANGALFETVAWRRGGRRPTGVWLATAAVVTAALLYGRARMAAFATMPADAPSLRVGIVQANLGLLEKRTQGIVAHEKHLEQTRELLAAGAVDLVVWPETAYVRALRRPLPLDGRLILAGLEVPLLFGTGSTHEEGGRLLHSNSVFLIGADGMIRDAYDKNLLIPFAEHVPLDDVLPALRRWFPNLQEFDAATETPALRLGPWRLATPICYEVVRPDFVRRMVRAAEPHLLVTLANDAWFGDSEEPWIHLALARLRAVEHRRYLVRATNSGVSAVVDPTGRVVVRSRLFMRENLRATVYPLEGSTFYGRIGDWPGLLAAGIVVLCLVRSRRSVWSTAGSAV